MNLLKISGNIAGGLGALICLVAGFTRLAGNYQLFSYEAITLFNAGVGLMVAGCLIKLQQLTQAQ